MWNLPSRSHTNIVHSVAHLPSISDIVFKHFSTFFNCGVVSTSCVISRILSQSSLLAYTFTGYNFMYESHHLKNYSDLDFYSFNSSSLWFILPIRELNHSFVMPIFSGISFLSFVYHMTQFACKLGVVVPLSPRMATG